MYSPPTLGCIPYSRMPKSKTQNKRKTLAIAVVPQTQLVRIANKVPKKKAKAKRSIPRGLTPMMSDGQRYKLALVNPFHPQALGARCCVYPVPNTVTQCVSGRLTLQTPNSSGGRLLLLPNPNWMAWATCDTNNSIGSNLGPAQQVQTSNVTGVRGAVCTIGNNANICSDTCVPALSSALANFRVVSCGFRIRSIQSTNSVNVQYTAAPVLCENSNLPWQSVAGSNATYQPSVATTTTQYQNWVESSVLSTPIAQNASLLTRAGTRTFTGYEVTQDECTLVSKPCTPSAFEFNNLDFTYNSTQGRTTESNYQFTNLGGETVGGPATAVSYSYGSTPLTNQVIQSALSESGSTNMAGFTGFWIDYRTFGITSGTPILQIEYVYHVEGVPNMSGIQDFGISFQAQNYSTGVSASKSLPIDEILNYARTFSDVTLPKTLSALDNISNLMTLSGLYTTPRQFLRQRQRLAIQDL